MVVLFALREFVFHFLPKEKCAWNCKKSAGAEKATRRGVASTL